MNMTATDEQYCADLTAWLLRVLDDAAHADVPPPIWSELSDPGC